MRRKGSGWQSRQNGLFLIAVLLVFTILLLALSTDAFFTKQNLFNLLSKSAASQAMACGMALVMLAGYFDLTGGAVVVLSLVGCFHFPSFLALPAWLSIGLILLVSMGLGALNGWLVTRVKMPSLLTTLVLIQIYRGMALKLSEGSTVSGLAPQFRWLGSSSFGGGIPVSAAGILLLVFLLQLMLKKTVMGYHIRGIGENPAIAEASGIPVGRVVWLLYLLAGLFYGISAVLTAGRVGVVSPDLANGQEIKVLAAVILGGCSLSGAKGSFWGCYLGITFFTVIDNAMNLLNISSYWLPFLQGIIILAAVWSDTVRNRGSRRRRG